MNPITIVAPVIHHPASPNAPWISLFKLPHRIPKRRLGKKNPTARHHQIFIQSQPSLKYIPQAGTRSNRHSSSPSVLFGSCLKTRSLPGAISSGKLKSFIICRHPIGGLSSGGIGEHSYSVPRGGTRSAGGMHSQGMPVTQISSWLRTST